MKDLRNKVPITFKVVLTFVSVDEILMVFPFKWNLLRSSFACGAIYYYWEGIILVFPILSFDSFESEKVVKCDSCGYDDY